MGPVHKIYNIPLIKIVLTIKYAAKKVYGNRARKGKKEKKRNSNIHTNHHTGIHDTS